MSIKIPISADFNGDDIKKQISQINAAMKQMGEVVAKANGQKFEPITLQGKDDLKYFVAQSEKLLKIQGELRNRMVKSGQDGKNPVLANWNHMYLNESARLKRQQEMLVFLGASFEDPAATPRPGSPSGDGRPRHVPPPVPKQNQWAKQGTRILQSGLNAAGPVGGVASNALGTGMSAGFGAGLAGLAGGMVALGVGKLIGAVADKISDAQAESIMNDQLMRKLGGGMGYVPLREGLRGASYAIGTSFNETQQLAADFSKRGNMSGAAASELPAEVLNAGRFARGFGLDPTQSMGTFAQFRGLGLTKSADDSRKLGLIIGETIAKSGAFAKADEVMEAIGNYATTQARQSLGALNLAGYTGELSALASSGIPGLDPAGSAALLGKVNAVLAAGGAKGEASQFFTSMVGNRMGLDPIQTAILREGGAFATNDTMFGKGSVASRYGIRGPKGDETFMQATLDELRRKYRDPGMLAMATSGHLGVGVNEAMALLSVNSNDMGTLQKRLGRLNLDMTGVNATGIQDLGQIETADSSGLKRIANGYLGRTGKQALTADEARDLKAAMDGGDQQKLKDELAKLAATKGAVETEGSKTRDTISGVSNVMQEYADKSLPILNESRAALLFLAGKSGAKGPQDLLDRAMKSRHDENVGLINQQAQAQIDEQVARSNRARHGTVGVPTAEEAALPRDQQLRAITERQARAKAEMDAADAEIRRIEAERDTGLAAEDARLKAERQQEQKRQEALRDYTPGRSPVGDHAVIEQIESGGRDYDRAGNVITSSAGARGRMQVLDSTNADPGYGVLPARDGSMEERARVGRDYYDALVREFGGDRTAAAAAYNAGPGRVRGLMAKHGADWLRHAPAETQGYVRQFNGLTGGGSQLPRAPASVPAQLPADEAGRRSSAAPMQHGPLAGELNVNLSMSGDLRRILNPPAPLTTRVSTAKPWGTA